MTSLKKPILKLVAVATASFALSATSASAAVAVTWDFSVGNEYGWTAVNGESWLDGEGVLAGQANGGGIDGYFDGINTTGSTINAHDGAHTTFIYRSPVVNFATVDASDPVLEFDFKGGLGNQSGTADPLNPAAIGTGISGDAGQKGFALLNLTTGNYDAVYFNSTQSNDTDTFSLTQADLTGAGVSLTDNYQLDFYDNDDGSWGWTRLEEVRLDSNAIGRIPEPSALGLIGLAGLALILRRRK